MAVPRASRRKCYSIDMQLGAKPKNDVSESMEVVSKRNKAWLVDKRTSKPGSKQQGQQLHAGIEWPLLIPSRISGSPPSILVA